MKQPTEQAPGATIYAIVAFAVSAIGATLGISALVAGYEVSKVNPIHQHGGAGFSLNAPVAAYALGALFFSSLAFLLYTCSRPFKRKRFYSPTSVATIVLMLPSVYIFSRIVFRLIQK